MRAFEIKHVRGTLLTALGSYSPNGLSGRNILAHVLRPVFPGLTKQECFQHLTYLKDRGLVDYVKESGIREITDPMELVYRLTPDGLDIATGVTQDPTILVEA